jgi:hypothetical protein
MNTLKTTPSRFAVGPSLLCLSLLFTLPANAVPESCLQLPERSLVCPHLIYKRAKVDVPIIAAKAKQMICICLSDLAPLRIEAHRPLEKVAQQALLTKMAKKLQLKEDDLLSLIRD